MAESVFDALDAALSEGGVDAAFQSLVDKLRSDKNYHEMFDARLMESRYRLGLPIILTSNLDDLEDPQRTRLEDAYLEACKEVGRLLLEEGRLREAWMYLRPVGDKALLAEALEKTEPNEETLEELIEVAVQEGVAPRRGFEFVLENYGICNAITMFEGGMHERPRQDQQEVVALLVNRLHEELLDNLKAEVVRQEGAEPAETTIAALVGDRDWLFQDDAYHIDTSHLHSVTRFARLIDDEKALRLALDLTEYGRRLGQQYQYETEEPFADTYVSHALFFSAKLGEQVDEALAYFRDKATSLAIDEHGSGPAEIYVALLSVQGKHQEALDAAAEFIPPGVPTSGFAPTLFELARGANAFGRLSEICRQRNDPLGYTAGLVEAKLRADGVKV